MSDRDTYRHEVAFRGLDKFEARCDRKIVICGVGALGSHLANLLARQGFGSIEVVDFDKIQNHNIANQFYGLPEVGASKATACANKIFRETGVQVIPHNKKLVRGAAKKLFRKSALVVDAFDNFESRKLLKEECDKLGIPCVHAGMSDDGFSEIKWNEEYRIPDVEVEQDDVCEYPLAMNLVHFTVSILAETIVRFIDDNTKQNVEFTLTDLRITTIG
jgi:hypothetical protein